MKRIIRGVGLATAMVGLVFGATACSSERSNSVASEQSATTEQTAAAGECSFTPDGMVGIAMPTKSLERWNRDGGDLEQMLVDAGFKVDLQFADNKVDMQISQLENMINAGAEILVIAAIDGEALGPVLETAADKGVAVIAYDRLIMGTEAVDYYATFDNYQIGHMQGEFIEQALDLKNTEGPYTLEMVAGSADDNNAYFYFGGAWDVLEQYYDNGTLVVESGRVPKDKDDWQSISIPGWDGAKAQAEIENRLNSFYRGTELNAVLSPNDSLALGISEALSANGYTPGENWPIITGQDADLANTLNMIQGRQAMTVWVDTRDLGDRVAIMVEQIANCDEVEVNDTDAYDNGLKVVPSYLLDPVVVTPDTIEEHLVDSGFFTREELGLN